VAGEIEIPESWLDTDGGQTLADSISALTSVLGPVGGVVSAVASGALVDRKLRRVAETVDRMRWELGEMRVEIDEGYIGSEDFEDLLEETLSKAARTRSETKRQMFARFITNDLRQPSRQPYEAKRRILRRLDELQEDHLRLLAAIVSDEGPGSGQESLIAGSRGGTLSRRTGLPLERVNELFQALQEENLATGGLGGMMTASGAETTKVLLTDLGRQLVDYLRAEEE